MSFDTLAISNAQRVNAVHREFADKSGAEVMQVLYYLALGVLAFLCVLVVVNRVQQKIEARKNAEHRAQVQEHVRKAHQLHTR